MNRTPENSTTTCGEEVTADSPAGAPGPIDPATGQHTCYYVLKPEERAKGFVRPVRNSYRHVGVRPQYPTRDLNEQEDHYKASGYVKIEESPDGQYVCLWDEKRLNSGCNTTTTMGTALSETWAADPSYYGATFCCHCRTHCPVEEFVWTGTAERLGS